MKKELVGDHEKIAYNCRKATMLIEKKQNVALNPREKMELQLHLAACSICRLYEQQSNLIAHMMDKLFKEPVQEAKLDKAFKEELRQRIQEKINNKIQ